MSNINCIKNEVVLPGRRNNQAWFAPSLAVLPAGDCKRNPLIMISATQLTGNDVGPLHFISTSDLGRTWTPPWESLNLGKLPLADDMFEAFGAVGYGSGLYYHNHTGSLLSIGHTVAMRDMGNEVGFKKEMLVLDWRDGGTAFSVWDESKKDFEPWQKVQLPERLTRLGHFRAAGCHQWHEAEDGTIFLPCVFHPRDGKPPRAGTLRCLFDGRRLEIGKTGQTVSTDVKGGIAEPSLVEFKGRYCLTIRSESGDSRMYHATSLDGLNWQDFEQWCWDDGTAVETENTQQHWLKRADALYLIYTRKSELSHGVFRHRAPLWMARVDPVTLRLSRDSEVIVFPEKGARTGNFCVGNVTAKESWIMAGEWVEGMFLDKKKGMRFFVENNPVINYNQYIGNLLLARIYWKQ